MFGFKGTVVTGFVEVAAFLVSTFYFEFAQICSHDACVSVRCGLVCDITAILWGVRKLNSSGLRLLFGEGLV